LAVGIMLESHHPSLSSTTTMDFFDHSEYPSHSPPPGPQQPAPHGWFIDSSGLQLGTGPRDLLPSIMVAGGYRRGKVTWEPFQEGGGPGYPFTDPLIPPFPSPAPIPLNISAEGIDNSDVSLLLASISELPFPTAFKMLLASSMALWAASAPDVATVRSLGLDTAINGFLSFIGPTPPTAISPAPFPVDIPPTPSLSASPLALPPPSGDDDTLMADTSSSHLRTPTPHPLEKGKMRALEPSEVPAVLAPTPVLPSSLPAPPAVPPSCVPVSDHARDRAQPSVAQTRNGKKASFAEAAVKAASKPGPPKPPLGPKADLAQRRSHNAPPPAQPSLVLSLTHHTLSSTLCAKAALAPPVLVLACNTALSADPAHANVRVSAAKWTPKGNLVMFAGPGVSRDALFATSHLLTTAVSRALPEDPAISSCLNVKWGKVLINSVPTGISKGCPTAHSPASCWQELVTNNPSLRHLTVCQLPSWVRWPSLYQPGSQSSLVFSFEDPDGSLGPALIRARHVYAFGSQCRVSRWRYPPPSPAKREAAEFAKKARNARSTHESVAGSSRPSAPPPVSVTQLAALQSTALLWDGDTSALSDRAAVLVTSSKWAPTSSPPTARSRKQAAARRKRISHAGPAPSAAPAAPPP